jgi:hypothetical protein
MAFGTRLRWVGLQSLYRDAGLGGHSLDVSRRAVAVLGSRRVDRELGCLREPLGQRVARVLQRELIRQVVKSGPETIGAFANRNRERVRRLADVDRPDDRSSLPIVVACRVEDSARAKFVDRFLERVQLLFATLELGEASVQRVSHSGAHARANAGRNPRQRPRAAKRRRRLRRPRAQARLRSPEVARHVGDAAPRYATARLPRNVAKSP